MLVDYGCLVDPNRLGPHYIEVCIVSAELCKGALHRQGGTRAHTTAQNSVAAHTQGFAGLACNEDCRATNPNINFNLARTANNPSPAATQVVNGIIQGFWSNVAMGFQWARWLSSRIPSQRHLDDAASVLVIKSSNTFTASHWGEKQGRRLPIAWTHGDKFKLKCQGIRPVPFHPHPPPRPPAR